MEADPGLSLAMDLFPHLKTKGAYNRQALLGTLSFLNSHPLLRESVNSPKETAQWGLAVRATASATQHKGCQNCETSGGETTTPATSVVRKDMKTRDIRLLSKWHLIPRKSQAQPAPNANLCLPRGNLSTASKRAIIAVTITYTPLYKVINVKKVVKLQQCYVGTLGYTNSRLH